MITLRSNIRVQELISNNCLSVLGFSHWEFALVCAAAVSAAWWQYCECVILRTACVMLIGAVTAAECPACDHFLPDVHMLAPPWRSAFSSTPVSSFWDYYLTCSWNYKLPRAGTGRSDASPQMTQGSEWEWAGWLSCLDNLSGLGHSKTHTHALQVI